MKANKNNIFTLSLSAIFMIAALLSCGGNSQSSSENYIQKKKEYTDDTTLSIVTLSRSTSYFTLRDNKQLGFEYELAEAMAEQTGKTLRICVAKDMNGLVDSVCDGNARLVAYPLVISNENKQRVNYAEKEFITHQVVVQRKGKGENKAKRDVLDLIGKKITVVQGSKYHTRMMHLNDEIGGGIEIEVVGTDMDEERLIKMVAEGKIEMTVADNDVASLQRRYFRNLDVALEVSHPQRGAWAVDAGDTAMMRIINKFFAENEALVEKLRSKYFEPATTSGKNENKVPAYIDAHHICAWDESFRQHAQGTPWDWRLLAAVAYTESRFNPDAGSFAGAKGLMQLMPETMLRLGGKRETMLQPDENVRLAVVYLNKMRSIIISASTPNDRVKLVLASYNAGLGHIRDAQRLCEIHGKNPGAWSDVEPFVRMLSRPEYYNLPDIKCGYLRGDETADYVNSIMSLYALYKRKIKK